MLASACNGGYLLLASASMRKNVGLRLSEEFLKQLDEVRGGVPREAWIRRRLEEAVRQELAERPVRGNERG